MPAVATTGGVLDAGTRSSAVDQPRAERLSDGRTKRRAPSLVSFIGAKAPLITPSVVIAVTAITCLLYIDPTRLASPDELFLYTVVGLAICLLVLYLAVLGAHAHEA